MPQGHQKPANRILVEMIAGQIEEYEIGANATVAEVIPGSCVIHDVYEHAIKESGDEPTTIVGVVECNPTQDLAEENVIGKSQLVLTGHFIAQIKVKTQNIAIGDRLVGAADGFFKELAVGAIGAQGAVVGKALEASSLTTIHYILAEVWTGVGEPLTAT